ncbi:outer membrane beta-barrel protein [Aridibaculum aurantiacum]|uniref:outer membrane beta-barrel protein n=1 Tax=Aridibaculum aurantiacum TaxID=2810307 RepID=UPI001A96ED28|nr:outer membrane beta-barrel protein [Aridibaculum aurantiacum]
MKTRIILAIAVLFAAMSNTANAQNRLRMELGYNVGIPTGSFKTNQINNTSFRGAIGEISYPVSNKFQLGLMSGFQNYHQKFGRQLYQTQDHQTISAVKTNSIDIIPLVLRGTYFPMGSNTQQLIQPYVSAGAGLSFVSYDQYLGEFGGSETAFPLMVQAGAGVIIPVGGMLPQTGIKLGATYNYSGYTKNDMNTKLGNIGVHAGFVFPMR